MKQFDQYMNFIFSKRSPQRLCMLLLFLIVLQNETIGQKDFYNQFSFSAQDSLRGTNGPFRTNFDVLHYDLSIKVDPTEKTVVGKNLVTFEALQDLSKIQLDLFENLKILKVLDTEGNELLYTRNGNAFFVEMEEVKRGAKKTVIVKFQGMPIPAENAPWDGGFVWEEDKGGNPWIGVACEGTGASLWWPNKDYLGDEPDSMDIRITVPKTLFANSNGNLIARRIVEEDWMEHHWKVRYPINNYNVTLNIAVYDHFSDVFISSEGDSLALDYYVLPQNLKKAKEHFKQVKPMLACYESIFGKYPFWEDGFALVETPYLGMEHQSAIAYGNGYMRGYRGGMIPKHMDWDYIIIHETGHEYFGNSISVADHAEMWIHESFTTYMEALYVECTAGYEEYLRYMVHFRNRLYIQNLQPIIGPMDVNWTEWNSSDHYFKGSWILHTLRNVINNDQLWFDLLNSFYQKHKQSIVKSEDFFSFVNEKTGKDFSPIFSQYFYYPDVPNFQYYFTQDGENTLLNYRWEASIESFDMPLDVGTKKEYHRIYPTTKWQSISWKGLDKKTFRVRRELFLIKAKEIKQP